MRNHFHLVETPEANLVAGMKWLLCVYAKRFNIRHKWCGHLFAGRYKALVVEGSGDGCLRAVCDYVHLNPVRAGLLRPEDPLEKFAWSSYAQYGKPAKERWPWLRVDRLLGEKGIRRDNVAGRAEFARQTERRRREEAGADYAAIRAGWCLGSEDFRRELPASEAYGAGANHYGSDRFETSQEKARRIIAQELKRLGWKENDLRQRRKRDPEKVKLARRLRAGTTMTLAWVAQHLEMGRWGYVSHLLKGKAKSAIIKDTCAAFIRG